MHFIATANETFPRVGNDPSLLSAKRGEWARWMPMSPGGPKWQMGWLYNLSLWPQENTAPCLLANGLHLPAPYGYSWRSYGKAVWIDPIKALDSSFLNIQNKQMVNHLTAPSRFAGCLQGHVFLPPWLTPCKCINGFLSPAWCVGVRTCSAQEVSPQVSQGQWEWEQGREKKRSRFWGPKMSTDGFTGHDSSDPVLILCFLSGGTDLTCSMKVY